MKVPHAPEFWAQLSAEYDVQVRLVISFDGWNKGFDLSRPTVEALAKLKASVGFSLYADSVED